jgi:CRP-like cAMP-binding protein
MARAKRANLSSKTPAPAFDAHVAAYWANALAPALDAHVTAYWTNALKDFFSFPAEAFDAHIGAYWTNKLKAFFSSPADALAFAETFERLEREDADALAALVAPGVPPSAVRNRLNPLYAALEPSLCEDDPDTRAAMRETALALSALHYAEITKSTRSTMAKAASLRERVVVEEPLARASVLKEQDAKIKPAKRIETLVHQRIAETLGISVRQVQRVLSRP